MLVYRKGDPARNGSDGEDGLEGNIGLALTLTAVAGLSTGLGGLIAVLVRKPGPRFMSAVLGFAAGVMVHVSFVELLQHSIGEIGFASAHLAFFAGMAVMFLVDVLVPHEYMAERREPAGKSPALMRTGLLCALGLGIHNFPEGMATFAGTLESTGLGVAIAVAIAIHNVPEGLAVAAPIYAATGSRRKAFGWSLLSGLAEPAGAALAALVLWPVLSEGLLGWMMAAVAGLMVFISFDELVPASREYGHAHVAILSVALGMVVMSLSLGLLR